MKTILLLLALAGPVYAQQRTSTEPLLVRSDSLTGVPLALAIRATGTVTLNAEGSVAVTVENASESDLVFLTYKTAEANPTGSGPLLAWSFTETNTITIYGEPSTTVQYMVIR